MNSLTLAKVAKSKSFTKIAVSEESETSADDQDLETGSMVFVRRQHHKNDLGKTKHGKKLLE